MKTMHCVYFLICSVLLMESIEFSTAQLKKTNNRRGGGGPVLYPAPRVGRSDPSFRANNVRAGLIAYPRVGRSDAEIRKWAGLLALQKALNKRAGPSATTGVWFGPRLGKRSIDNTEIENSWQQKKEY